MPRRGIQVSGKRAPGWAIPQERGSRPSSLGLEDLIQKWEWRWRPPLVGSDLTFAPRQASRFWGWWETCGSWRPGGRVSKAC